MKTLTDDEYKDVMKTLEACDIEFLILSSRLPNMYREKVIKCRQMIKQTATNLKEKPDVPDLT